MANDTFKAENARLKKEIEALKAVAEAKKGTLSMAVGQSGVVMVKGLNARFPVSLYGNQWDRLLGGILGAEWATSVADRDNGGFGGEFLTYVTDAMGGPVDDKGKPIGNPAHIARREVAKEAAAAKS